MITIEQFKNLKVGMKVKIIDTPPSVGDHKSKMIPSETITWTSSMNDIAGEIGKVLEILSNGTIKVGFPAESDSEIITTWFCLPDWIDSIVGEKKDSNNPEESTREVELNADMVSNSYTDIEKYERELYKRFPGREEAIHVALLGILSRHPVFFLGPPGTAKSLILSTIGESMGMKKFEKLITEYTIPEELFGPVSIPQMKKGIWTRITEGMLPEANIAFLDEIFKSTTILNSLLRLINERKYKNGKVDMDVPLYALFTASNEIPSDPSLLALYDRLVLRVVTDTISDPTTVIQIKKASTDTSWKPPQFPVNVDKAIKEVQKVEVSDELIALTTRIEMEILSKGIQISNRKQVQTIDVIKASAHIHGRKKASLYDLSVMRYIYWNVIEDLPVLEKVISENITPALSELKKVKEKIFSDIYEGGEGLKKSMQTQHLLWRTAKTLIERIKAPQSKEEEEEFIKEVANIMDILDKYTPLLVKKPMPRWKW